jgi:hypothetical protein
MAWCETLVLYPAILMYRPTESAGKKFFTKIKRKNKNNIIDNNNSNANTVLKISRKLYIPTSSDPPPLNKKFRVPALVTGCKSYAGL